MIQLKNVHFSERLSEETNAFAADVWFKGKKVGYAKNDGQGGCTFIHRNPDNAELFREAEKWAKELPPNEFELGGKSYSIDSDLELQVDLAFDAWLEKKEEKRRNNKGIRYVTPEGNKMIATWKGHSIPKLKKSPVGVARIKQTVDELLQKGCTILNTNLNDIIPDLNS